MKKCGMKNHNKIKLTYKITSDSYFNALEIEINTLKFIFHTDEKKENTYELETLMKKILIFCMIPR